MSDRPEPPPDAPAAPDSPTPRRRLLQSAGLVTGAALVGAGGAAWLKHAQSTPARAPLPAVRRQTARGLNILLITSDQERADLPFGLPLPGHDRLREAGTEFTQWHVNTTPCSPSRATLYYGQHTQKTGMVADVGVFPGRQVSDGLPSLGHYLRANGYLTAYKGKWQLSEIATASGPTPGRYPNTRDALEPFGFSDFNFDGDPRGGTWGGYKVDAQTAAEAARWLHTRGAGSDKPWLLAVNFVNPQDINFLATDVAQMVSRRQADYLAPLAGPPVDPLYARRWDFPLPRTRDDDLNRKPWAHRNHLRWSDLAFGRISEGDEAWRAYQNGYFNAVRDMDRHLLTVLDALDSSGQADRTIVVYTADHGEMGGAHGLRQCGPFMYQENTRVPFIVRHPDVRGSRRTEALGCAVDLVPTLLQMAGCASADLAQAYPQLVGVPLAEAVASARTRTERDERGILFNYSTLHHIDVDFAAELLDRDIAADRLMPLRAMLAGMRPLPQRRQPTLFRGIHTGRHKFARYFSPAEHHRPLDWETLVRHNSLELYDLDADPGERNNLAHAPELVKSAVMEFNGRLDALVQREVGMDLGDELPGPWFLKRL